MFRRKKKNATSGSSKSKKKSGTAGSSAATETKTPIPLADQETCAKYLKLRMEHLGLQEAKNYYQGLSTFVLHNRFIHLDVNISTKQLIISTTIHEVVSGVNKKELERTESYNSDNKLNRGSLIRVKEQCVDLTRHVPITTLQTDSAFESVVADFLEAAKEADKTFVGHKAIIDQELKQQTNHKHARKDTGAPKSFFAAPSSGK